MGRPMVAGTRAMYDAITAAGAQGLSPDEVRAADTTGRTEAARLASLQTLRKSGHIFFNGTRSHGRWFVGTNRPAELLVQRKVAPPAPAPAAAVQLPLPVSFVFDLARYL